MVCRGLCFALLLALLCASWGCAPRASQGAPVAPLEPLAPLDNAPGGAPLDAFAGVSAAVYSSRPSGSGVRGGEQAESVNRALSQVLAGRGATLTGDGRLAELAAFVGRNMDTSGHPPRSASVDGFARRVGLIEPMPLLMMFQDATQNSWVNAVSEMMRGAPRNIAYNRSGVASFVRQGHPVTVVALSASSVDIEPVARHVEAGVTVPIRGVLRDGYRHPQIDVTLPDGTVKRLAEAEGRSFSFAVLMAARGAHRIELLAEGPSGLEVVANFPVFASTDDPPLDLAPPAPATALDLTSAGVVAELFARLNDARRSAGVPLLESHDALAQVAEAHSRDMVEAGFFGHVSPTNGDPAARIRRRGQNFALIAENVGRGGTADEVHKMLLDSPGHRANMLDPHLTHVGIGVAFDKSVGQTHIVATFDFAGVARPLDLGRAPDEITGQINARRAQSNLPPLVVDRALAEAAQRGVEQVLRDPNLSQQQVVESVSQQLAHPTAGQATLGKRMSATKSHIFSVVALEQATKAEAALDPKARFVGVGVGQSSRPDSGPITIVVLVIGWPR